MSKAALQFVFVSPLFRIFKRLTNIESRIGQMATQEEVNALSERLGNVSSQLTKGFNEIQGEIQDLKDQAAAGASIDLSTLESQVDSLAGQAQALDDIVPDADQPVSEEEAP